MISKKKLIIPKATDKINNLLEKKIFSHNLAIQSLKKQTKVINKAISLITKNISLGGKVLLCGNGGSAADAQHLAAEFLVRLRPKINRNPLPALSLLTDVSTLSACGNDYSFQDIFLRPFKGLAKKNDILIAISTSGKSKNVLKVLKYAKTKKFKTIGFLGNKGGNAKKYCDFPIVVKSSITAHIQEAHIFLGHYIFESVESAFLKKKNK